MAYCAYQERCTSEMMQKLDDWEASEELKQKVVKRLVKDKYLDEKRFAMLFAGGKFRLKKWGRIKVRMELRKRKVPADLIEVGLAEIEEREYLKVLSGLFQFKLSQLKSQDGWSKKAKVLNSLRTKGYEDELIWSLIDKNEASFKEK